MIRRYLRHHLKKLHELLDARDAPHSVAGGTAIGVFFGFVPIFGLKTLCAMGCSMLTRCSVVAGVIGVSLHDVFLPIWPLILRYQFQLGYWILSHPHHLPPRLSRSDFKPSEILQWDNFVDIGLPLLIGGVLFAIPASLVTYGVVLMVMKARSARRKKLEQKPELIDKAWEQP